MAMPNLEYSELLEDFFHEIVVHGCGHVLSNKLLRWTNRTRVTPSFWKLLNDVCSKVLEATDQHEHGYKLFVGEGTETYSFLIWDGGDARVPDGWWKSVEHLSEAKRRGRKFVADDEIDEASD